MEGGDDVRVLVYYCVEDVEGEGFDVGEGGVGYCDGGYWG